jgi:hypothetical protein
MRAPEMFCFLSVARRQRPRRSRSGTTPVRPTSIDNVQTGRVSFPTIQRRARMLIPFNALTPGWVE